MGSIPINASPDRDAGAEAPSPFDGAVEAPSADSDLRVGAVTRSARPRPLFRNVTLLHTCRSRPIKCLLQLGMRAARCRLDDVRVR